MKYLLRALGASLAMAGFVWLCGSLLPAKHEASASVRLKASPEAVWAVLSAVENYPRWRSDVAAAEVIGSGPVLTWKEADARGRVMVHALGPGDMPEKWVDKLIKGDLPQGGERVFLIVADEDGGSRVALTEIAELRDPWARFRVRFVSGYAENLVKLLDDLRKRLAE